MRNELKHICLFLSIFLFIGCTTQKNTTTTRMYHNMISHYNIYFNGIESYKRGVRKAEDEKVDNYSQILPIFLYNDKTVAQSVFPEMDRAAKKATKVITLHSITVKPELKKGPQTQKEKEFYSQKEFNKWMDENYLLLGKSYVFKNEYNLAIETFKHIITDFSHTSSMYDALVWLARCYIHTREYREAEKILNLVQADENTPARLYGDLYATYAEFYLDQKNYEKCLSMLEKALEYSSKKFNRIRYTFILAQLYQHTGNLNRAAENYKKVIKLNPPYEMTLNAKINLAGSFEAGKEDSKEIRNILLKMLKDDKNKEYQDQIYYALGQISMKEGNTEEALDLFMKSVSAVSGNTDQKAMTYLTMGDIYYTRHEYEQAHLYYDSTLLNLDQGYENYELLSKMAGSLNRLVENLNIYALEDSLQVLAKMSDAERKNIIEKIISGLIQKEQEELRKVQQENADIQFGMMNQAYNNPRNTTESSGKWYFYNNNAKSFGQPEFRMIWGNRKLEDNWRRKNKQTMEAFEPMENKEAGEETEQAGPGEQGNNKSVEYYMKNIPLTDEALAMSHDRLKKALFNVGLIYIEELNDQDKAVESFSDLVKRYPGDSLTLLSYYRLYDIYQKQGNKQMSEQYKGYILAGYPQSAVAQLLSNPEYLAQMQQKEDAIKKHYQEVFGKYQAGDHSSVISDVENILLEYPGNSETPRFLLLKALSIGQLYGNERLKSELEIIVKNYPGHEAGVYSRELIGYIYAQAPDLKIADTRQLAEQLYEYNPEEIHNMILSLSPKTDINQLKFNLVNFNLDHFNDMNLGISTEESGTIRFLKISSFKEIGKAIIYRDSLLMNSGVFKGIEKEGIQVFLISDSNLLKLYEDKDTGKYFLFYEKNY